MIVKDVYDLLNEKAPFAIAEEWDNAGLLVGDANATVTKIVVALDVTDAVIRFAVKKRAELIVTHHPVIFDPLKSVPSDSVVYRLAASGLSVICAHTNADKAAGGVNDCLAEQLGLTDVTVAPDGMSRIGRLPADMSASVFGKYVSECLDTSVRIKAGGDAIRTVALCGGAGADLVLPLLSQADAAVTGEVKHHEWLAVPAAKTMVDGGHYATEIAVTDRFTAWLTEAFPSAEILLFKDGAPYGN